MRLATCTDRCDAGTSLMELLVVMAITGLVIGGAMSLMGSVQVSKHELDEITSSRQGARVALAQMQTDLLSAGVGLTWMTANFPLVVPGADGGIELRSNPGGVSTFLTQDVTGGAALKVGSTTGFAVGDTVAIHDNSGAIELHEIATLNGNQIGLSTPVGGEFLVADGAALVRVEIVEYRLDGEGQARQLVREGERGATTMASGIIDLRFRYFDDAGVEFTPDSAEAQLRIRGIGVEIESQTERPMLTAESSRSYRLTTRTTPRTLAMAGQ